MRQINELQRIEQDKNKFKTICKKIGYNNAVDGELNTIKKDYDKISYCKALIIQSQRPSQEEQQIKGLLQGQKIILGCC